MSSKYTHKKKIAKLKPLHKNWRPWDWLHEIAYKLAEFEIRKVSSRLQVLAAFPQFLHICFGHKVHIHLKTHCGEHLSQYLKQNNAFWLYILTQPAIFQVLCVHLKFFSFLHFHSFYFGSSRLVNNFPHVILYFS